MHVRFTARRLRLALAAAVGLGLAAAGIAYAVIPDANGTIHGCYKNNNGAFRIIDPSVSSCGSGETAIQWMQTSAASTRPPHQFLATSSDPNNLNYTTLATLNVDAGAYVILAKAVIADDDDAFPVFVDCRLRADNPSDFDEAITMVSPSAARSNVMLILPHTFTSSGTITLVCAPSNPIDAANVNAELIDVTAVHVAGETH